MKAIFSIVPVTIAILLLTLFPVVPHHHSGGGGSLVMEIGAAAGVQEGRPVSGIPVESAEHEEECIVNARYVLPSQLLHDLYGTETGGDLHHPDCFMLSDPLLFFTPEVLSSGILYNTDIFLYPSAPSGLCCGLRAPPYCAA